MGGRHIKKTHYVNKSIMYMRFKQAEFNGELDDSADVLEEELVEGIENAKTRDET